MSFEDLLGRDDIPDDVRDVLREEIARRTRSEEDLRHALEDSRRRADEVEGLLAGARAVLVGRSFAETARSIFDTCKRLTGGTAGYVALLSADGAENEVLFLDAGGLPCTVDESLPMPIRGLRERAYRSKSVVYENGFADSAWHQYLPEGHCELGNVMFAPLVVDGEAAGVLGIANKPGGFSENDARIASVLGELTAIALRDSQNLEALTRSEAAARAEAQRMAHELELAGAVQRSTLPEHCLAEGLDVEHHFEPCEGVGGDFLGVIRSSSGRCVIYAGDVSGHGLPSSLIVHLLTGIIHEVVDPDEMTAAEALSVLHERLSRRLQTIQRYVTVCLLRFSPKIGRLAYASAGYPWPVLVREGEARELTGEPGAPLGLWEEGHYSDQAITLEPQDTVFLTSDGILEAKRRDGSRVQREAMTDWCERACRPPVRSPLCSLMSSFRADVGDGPLEDDVVSVAIRRVPIQVFTLADAREIPDAPLVSLRQEAIAAGRTVREADDLVKAVQVATELVGAAADGDDYIRLAHGLNGAIFQAAASLWGRGTARRGTGRPRAAAASQEEARLLSELRSRVDYAEWDPAQRCVHMLKRWSD